MARREDIETSIWDEPEFQALSATARFVYIWSFTNQRCGMAGIYKVARGQIELETGHAGVQLDRALEELQEARFLFYDGRIMFVRTRVKHLRTKASTIAKSVNRDLASIGLHPFVALWWDENAKCSWLFPEVEKPENIGDLEGSTITPPAPLQGLQGSGKGKGSSSKRSEEQQRQGNQLPDDFPDELKPHLEDVERILGHLAVRHGAKQVVRLSLASVLMARPRKPLVRAAYDFAAWADSQVTPRKDVVSGYRNWLERTNDLASVEQVRNEQGGKVVPIQRAAHLERMDRWKNYYTDEESA